ncbi:mitochondrial intermembrane space import and assembly protein [Ceratobasidium sp. AG-Ba]|nr:mitochondrial intermembrane space import and assembly protein [Ceratobasidium sp. AG-Ba]
MPRAKQEDAYQQEYDELLDDEDEYEYEEEDGDVGFSLAGRLDPPTTSPLSCHAIYTQIQEGIISLEADYQRDVVWNNTKQSGLIDSVYRDYFIPPILFAVHDIEGERVKVCIDGKQRLTSIQRFMDGYIPVKIKGKNWYYQRNGSRATGKLIPEGFKKQFAAKQLLCVEFDGLTEAMERDIFQRVQLGMALNEAEKQKAISSPTVNWIRGLVAKYFEGDDGIPQHLPMNMKRSKDFQCFGQFVCMALSLPKLEMPTSPKLSRFLQEQSERNEAFKNAVEKAVRTLHEIARKPELSEIVGSTPIAPVELVHICVLCLMLSGRSSKVIAQKIKEMRDLVREKHVDVRANQRVAKTFAEYLAGFQAPGLPGPEEDWQPSSTTKPTSNAKGRKRKAAEEDDMELDEDETPVAKTTKPRAKPSPSEPGVIKPSDQAPAPTPAIGSEPPADDDDEEKERAANQGAYNPETGEINWDCPCLGGMAHGPCGPQFREAFSCFVYSNEEPKGVDCVEKFKAMQDCFREHPDVYGEEIDDDEEDEPVEETGRPSDQDQPNSAKPASTPESNDRDEEHKDTPSGVPPPPSKAPSSRQNAPTANVSPENTATKRGKTH